MQELSLNILDIAQNSVKANATLIEIMVEVKPKEDLLLIIIRDNGCGMTSEQLSKVCDPFFTSRTTRKVGLGIPLLKMAAEMTGGNLKIVSVPGEGTEVSAQFGLRHIDRMPLGDIAATMVTLIQCNPNLDFVYTCKNAEETFRADTRSFREVLEDVPLSDASVLVFIKDLIFENTAIIIKD